MKKKTKKQDAISKHFSELGKKSWEARKAKILKMEKEKKVGIGNTNLG